MKYSRLYRLFSRRKVEIQPVEQNTQVEYELVAVIAAALQEYMKTDPGVKLKVVSIKRTGQSVPLWNRAGRLERISGKL